MKKMTQQNLQNIRCRFEEKTGVDLNRRHRRKPLRKMWALALASIFCAFLVGATYPLFSSLNGDDLYLQSVYEGNGVFSIHVENRSDRELRFQNQLKLMRWSDAEEVPSLGGKVTFVNTEIPPNSQGTMILDLSEAYDIPSLEKETNGKGEYYLVLTNNHFVFGQDWMCSVQFTKETPEQEEIIPETSEMPHEEPTLSPMPVEALIAEEIEEELKFYFEEGYMGMSVSSNDQNWIYMQKVQELLTQFDGTVVPPAEPMLIVNRLPEGIIFDDTIPADMNYILAGQQRHAVDGYGRLVGRGIGELGSDHSLQLMALLPSYKGEVDGGVYLPLLHFFTYEVSAIQQDNAYAFIYGQLLSFAEMESYKVYQDDQYVVYEMTELFYTDLDAYIDDFLTTDQRIYFDDTIRQRIHNIYNYYKDPEVLEASFHYHLPGLCPEIPVE